METSPEAGQSILVQPLAGAEPLYSPPQRTAAHGAASGDGSMGLHRCRTEPVLVAGDDCGPLASGISRKETALRFYGLSLYQKSRFPKITPKTHLRRRGKRIQTRNANYNSIQPERIIPQWSEEIRQRARIGDWEGDTVYGGVGKGLLVTQVDRKSRFLRAGLLAKRDASLTKAVICQLLKDVPVKASVWTMGLNSLNSRLWKPNSILWSISRSRTNHGSGGRTKTPMDCCVSSSQRAAISTLFRKSL